MSGKGPLAPYVDAVMDCAALVANARRAADLANLEQWEAEEAARDPRRPGVYNPGDRVRYSARFVQGAGGGVTELVAEWVIQECSCELCALGEHVCTTEWSAGYDTWRHLHRANIRHKGMLTVDDLPPGMFRPITMPRIAPVAPLRPLAKCRR